MPRITIFVKYQIVILEEVFEKEKNSSCGQKTRKKTTKTEHCSGAFQNDLCAFNLHSMYMAPQTTKPPDE